MSIPRCKFKVKLAIKELTNIPHATGSVFVKWYVKDSAKPDARGKTDHVDIQEHKTLWDYQAETTVRIGTDKTNSLRHSLIVFDVLWENSTSGRINVGKVEINLSEYVRRDLEPYTYLLQNSKINCVLNVALSLKQVKGPTDFKVPKFSAPQILSDLAGIIDEQRAKDDARNEGFVLRLHNTFSVEWDPRPGYLGPQACVEDIFKGGDGFGQGYWNQYLADERARVTEIDRSKPLREVDERDGFRSWLTPRIPPAANGQ
jgi:hypothetical protein